MTKSILIVEDDPALLRGLRDNFEAQGYEVRTANDGQRGLVSVLNQPPDLLLLDLMLPRVDGFGPGASPEHAHYHVEREEPGGGPDSRIRVGRGRLSHEAVQHPRIARSRESVRLAFVARRVAAQPTASQATL